MNKIYYERPRNLQKNSNKEHGENTNETTIEQEYFNPSYQESNTDIYARKPQKNNVIKEWVVNALLVILSIIFVVLMFAAIAENRSMHYHWERDEKDFWYEITDGRYASLLSQTWDNRFNGVHTTAGLEQCYAIAEYFEAASLYRVAVERGNLEEQEKYAGIMEEKLEYMTDIQYIAEDINKKLGIE